MNESLNMDEYMSNALRTEAPVPALLGDARFTPAAIDVGVRAGKFIDLLKKNLIYRRVIGVDQFVRALQELIDAAGDAIDEAYDSDPVELPYNPRLLHAALGGLGENGELLEAMQTAIDDGARLDLVNVAEEAGDVLWYSAMLLDEVEMLTGQGPGDVAARNIAKLRLRFPEKFTLEAVTHRNLGAERAVLEGRA